MDLYNIPGDTGGKWRYEKCLDWISGFPNEIVPSAKMYFSEHNWDDDDKTWFIFLYSACYSYPTALIMFDLLDYRTLTEREFDLFWDKYKPLLIFQSDRRYIKNMNQFKHMVFEFLNRSGRKPYSYIHRFVTDDKVQTYGNMYAEVSSWRYYGRFGTILFMYNYMQMMNVPMDYPSYDWKNGATTTSAIFNILYMDDEAMSFDNKHSKTRLSEDTINMLTSIATSIGKDLTERTGKPYGIITISSDLCSYRKLFKGVRYNGYYVDRQLEEINTLMDSFKNDDRVQGIIEFLMRARRETLDERFLGEAGGWNGIRKERCKLFLQTGIF